MKARSIALIIAIWTLLALLFALQIRSDAWYAGRNITGSQALVLSLAGWYGWALLSPLVIVVTRRLGTHGSRLMLHLPLVLLLTVVKIVATTAILRRAGFPQSSMFSLANV